VVATLEQLLSAASESSGEITVQRAGDVSVVTLNRPAVHNSIRLQMWLELAEVVRSTDARVVVLRGHGAAAFSVGADITEFPEQRMDAGKALAYSRAIAGAIDAIRDSPAPVIAMIRGLAVGGGCELAAACDLRIADGTARMGIPIGRLGVTLGLSEASALVDLLGLARARALVLSGALVGAEDAHRIGLLDTITEADALARETAELATRIAQAAPQTISSTKRVLAAAARGATRRDAEAFADELFSVYEGSDLREGVDAFRIKREPRFGTTGGDE
jgi:enoyl-CoA hydratase